MNSKLKSLRVSTLAGSPHSSGYKDGPLSECCFSHPSGICVSEDGVVLVADSENHVLRSFTLNADGLVTTIAGCGQQGRKDGLALEAWLSKPSGICCKMDGGYFFVEESGCTLRTLIDGVVATLIGEAGPGFKDGSLRQAQIHSPRGVCQESDGTVYIADNGNHRIRRVDTSGNVTSIGSGANITRDGSLSLGSFLYPSSVCVLPSGIIYVGELYRIRKVDMEKDAITTFDSTHESSLTAAVCPSPLFDLPDNSDGNRLFYSDSNGARIMCMNENGKVKLIAGCGSGMLGGILSEAKFSSPRGLAFTQDGDLLICDGNHCIRIIKDMYPPQARVSPLAASFSLSLLCELDEAQSTSPSSPLLPFHPQLAALAYPSLSTITKEDIERAKLPDSFTLISHDKASTSSTPSTAAIPKDIESRLQLFYGNVGLGNDSTSTTSILSALVRFLRLRDPSLPQTLTILLIPTCTIP